MTKNLHIHIWDEEDGPRHVHACLCQYVHSWWRPL